MWTEGRTLHPCRDFVCAPLPSLGVCRKHKRNTFLLPPNKKKKICITLVEHLMANGAVTCLTKALPLHTRQSVKSITFFLTKPLTGGLSCPWSNCVFWICYQIWGRNRIFPNGSRRVQWRYRSVRHQPFLLPPSPVWNRHLGMRNWCTPTHTIIKEHALLNGVAKRWTFLQLKIDSAAIVSACFYFLILFFNRLNITAVPCAEPLSGQKSVAPTVKRSSWRCFSTCTLMNTSVSEERDVKWQRCTFNFNVEPKLTI